jgi:hypothetical protein
MRSSDFSTALVRAPQGAQYIEPTTAGAPQRSQGRRCGHIALWDFSRPSRPQYLQRFEYALTLRLVVIVPPWLARLMFGPLFGDKPSEPFVAFDVPAFKAAAQQPTIGQP